MLELCKKLIRFIFLLFKCLVEGPSAVMRDTAELSLVPPHFYPKAILCFWGVITSAFIINLFISCVWYAPAHIQAAEKLKIIDECMRSKQYRKAVSLHEELCTMHPKDYPESYRIEITQACFAAIDVNDPQIEQLVLGNAYFRKGLEFLRGQDLNETRYAALCEQLPSYLREEYASLFDVYCCEKKDGKKEYKFVLNDIALRAL